MTKNSFSIMQEGGFPREETYAFIDGASKPTQIIENDSKGLENRAYVETSKKLFEKRRNIYPLCGLLLAAVLSAWLIGLTMVREFQLADLRKNVEELRKDLDELKRGIMDDNIIDGLKGFEDEVNAEAEGRLSGHLDLYDDPVSDDEDFIEDDLAEGSGGFWNSGFSDEEASTEKSEDDEDAIDQTDFLGEVMEATLQDKSQFSTDKHPPIKKIMRILQTGDGELKEKYARSRRDIISETADGVPVLAESYEAARAKNFSHSEPDDQSQVGDTPRVGSPKMLLDWNTNQDVQQSQEHKRKQFKKFQSDVSSTTAPGSVDSGTSVGDDGSSTITTNNRKVFKIRKPIIKSGLAADYDAAFLQRKPEETVKRRTRRFRKHRPQNRALESMEEVDLDSLPRGKPSGQNSIPILAAHFSGNTADLQIGKHEHYEGNGRLRHPMDVPYTKWSAAPWLPRLGLDAHFPLQDGAVTVPQSGIYFVYAQVYFHDSHDTNGFKVYRNNGVGDEAVLQCTTMTHSNEKLAKANTCYTAGAFHLTKGDTIFLKNLGSMRYSIMQPGKSFFGLIKLGDAKLR